MTLEQAKQLQYGDEVFNRIGGRVYRYKVNGKPKTWKRTPNRIQVPLKYGLYQYLTATERDMSDLHLTREEAERSAN